MDDDVHGRQGRTPRVVIVGGGFGGLHAARALARRPVEVTLIDRANYHLFTPLLYQAATAALSPGDIAQPIRALLRRQRNARVLLGEVTGIDPVGRRVLLADGELDYDYLILAAGTRQSYFGHEEWAPVAPALKTLDDAVAIRGRILAAFEAAERADDPAARAALLTFVVIGGGATGVELAGAIAEIARHTVAADFRTIDPTTARVILLEGGPRLLAAYPPALSERAAVSLRALGVEVRTSTRVTDVTAEAVCIGGETIPARTALWAAGVVASPLTRDLGVPLDRQGRVAVAPDLTVPGHPEIAVVGDLAALADRRGRPLPGVCQVAMQEGRAAGENIWRAVRGEPRRPFHYHDRGDMATIGRGAAVGKVFGARVWGRPAWLLWLALHLFYLNGFDNRVLVFTQWLWSLLTWERGARLITAGGAAIAARRQATPLASRPAGD